MNRKIGLPNLLIIFVVLLLFQTALPQTLSDQVREFLRNRIEAAGIPPKLSVGEELIHASVMLPLFYERRTYHPAWMNENGLLPQVDQLVTSLREAYMEGLRPTDYHFHKITSIISKLDESQQNHIPLSPNITVDLELLLTDAFLIYGSHLLAGKINPVSIDPEWFANRREADLAEVLHNALNSGQISKTLSGLLPPQPDYSRLRISLNRYRDIARNGGWQSIPEGLKLEKGMQDSRILNLRKRLQITGDLTTEAENPELFDSDLELAVRRFQTRHGLDIDGVVGPATLAALNVSAEERFTQIEINLERWRWLPQDLGQRYILVNIANFELDIVENGELVMDMRIIVGRDYRRTPVFSDKMTYLVFAPYWHIPTNLAVQDIVPLIRKDSGYLAKQKIKIFDGWGINATEIDPATVDWSQISAKNFRYRFRQDPGPNNALGQVKFMFPNQFNVYLHDTPARELFSKTSRTFSSGCIRVDKPVELAEYVLRGHPRGSRENILAIIKKWQEQTVRLPEPIPVHLLYWTTWVDRNGIVHFRKDIYNRDKPLYDALREEPQVLTSLK